MKEETRLVKMFIISIDPDNKSGKALFQGFTEFTGSATFEHKQLSTCCFNANNKIQHADRTLRLKS